jgi:hypothetical protein
VVIKRSYHKGNKKNRGEPILGKLMDQKEEIQACKLTFYRIKVSKRL